MEINVSELPFRPPRVITHPPEVGVIALMDPDDLTICLNSLCQYGELWEEKGNVELRCEAILVHETVHAVLRYYIGAWADMRLDGDAYQPIDNWINDYAISRPMGTTYPVHRGFWRKDV